MSGNKVIYTPKGKAGEYSELAANLYTGCSHGCHYCYAPLVLHRDRIQFHADVRPRTDILKKLEREAPAHKGREVFLCFTCDPYPPEIDTFITREAIQILHKHEVGVNILTKGGVRILRDMDLFKLRPDLSRVGASLTFINYTDSLAYEPHAGLPVDRIHALRKAHEAGLRTWVSLEPIIDLKQTLELIKLTAPFVDHFKVGRLNYDPQAETIDWATVLKDVTSLLDELGADYYIKKDLACFSGKALE